MSRDFSGKAKGSKHGAKKPEESQKSSPPAGRISVKERLGSKVETSGRNTSPPGLHGIEKRSRNGLVLTYFRTRPAFFALPSVVRVTGGRKKKKKRRARAGVSKRRETFEFSHFIVNDFREEESMPTVRKDHQLRSTLSSTVESIDSKRSTIDEAHFVPNYDESSDEVCTPRESVRAPFGQLTENLATGPEKSSSSPSNPLTSSSSSSSYLFFSGKSFGFDR